MDTKTFVEKADTELQFTYEEWEDLNRTITYQFRNQLTEFLSKNLWNTPTDSFDFDSKIEFDKMVIDFAKLRYKPNVDLLKRIPIEILSELGWECSHIRFDKTWSKYLYNVGYKITFSKKSDIKLFIDCVVKFIKKWK